MEEVSGPLVAIVLVLSAVFLPVIFVDGLTGEMYRQFAVAITVSVVLSGIVTWAFLSLVAWQWMKRFDQGPLEKIAALVTGKSRPSTDA